ncbi:MULTISPECIES: PLD nuclease N-terminal domain-containing protein [unclassified Nocardioides]|uniref:PLD nuclease N-terminal domain-containing protein n=1 Tax=unclassified Nocardioides TaxID=2615069 RepID=UPI001154794A|nr:MULTISPECIES: PLD nuclease N-terminal domain-containing protein [unclassified Nocardioides]TQK68425.1 phospholipase D-like protein [Nocardioides sp. SLBN-35]WGY02262.1 PLDc N-terminal domain-containing protein [Nocardioides sp. QY071]
MLRLLPPLLVLILWVYCLVDVITAREDSVRNLAKTWWLLIVFFFPLAGSIAWFIAGRPVTERPLTREQGAAPSYPEYERRGRFAAADPEKDEEFLRKVRERAEEQRRAHEQRKREQERREQEGPEPV